MTAYTQRFGDGLRLALTPQARRRVARMTETFAAEVGVLLLVFPILEKLIATGHVSLRYMGYSFAGSMVFYAVAAILAVFTKGE